MDEDFDFHIGSMAYLPDLIKGQLPGQHHAAAAQTPGRFHAAQIVNGSLSGQVQLKIGQLLTQQHGQPQILDDQRVYADFIEKSRVVQGLLHLFVGDQGIHGHVDLHPSLVSEVHGLFHFLIVEIARVNPGVKRFSAQIDGVRSVFNRRDQLGGASGRY